MVVATSDAPPLVRLRAAHVATAIAEYFRDQGADVLLVMDSVTRLAMAQREIGLAAGEPPSQKGYTPSVFSLLARLIERAGHYANGSITAFYTVLMEGDDELDPLVDAARSMLDGHIMLDRGLANQNHFPAISVLRSLSRLMPAVATREHLTKVGRLRQLLSCYAANEDLIRVGAYQGGTDPLLDEARRELDARDSAFLLELVYGVLRNRSLLDWTLDRFSAKPVSKTDAWTRNILRLGAYELSLGSDIPVAVAINEAVELGKRFGSEESGAFINGILDRISDIVRRKTTAEGSA